MKFPNYKETFWKLIIPLTTIVSGTAEKGGGEGEVEL